MGNGAELLCRPMKPTWTKGSIARSAAQLTACGGLARGALVWGALDDPARTSSGKWQAAKACGRWCNLARR
jgi:hypothetical protein